MNKAYNDIISEAINREKENLRRIVTNTADLRSTEAIQQSCVLDELVVEVMREQLMQLQQQEKVAQQGEKSSDDRGYLVAEMR